MEVRLCFGLFFLSFFLSKVTIDRPFFLFSSFWLFAFRCFGEFIEFVLKFRMSIGLSYRAWKKQGTLAGLKPVSSRQRCGAPTNWSAKLVRNLLGVTRSHIQPRWSPEIFSVFILQWHSAILIPQSINAIHLSYMFSLDDGETKVLLGQ